jgi:hypothetical protein
MTPGEQVEQWIKRTGGDLMESLTIAAIEKGLLGYCASAGFLRAKPPHKTMPARGAPPSIDIPAPEKDDE